MNLNSGVPRSALSAPLAPQGELLRSFEGVSRTQFFTSNNPPVFEDTPIGANRIEEDYEDETMVLAEQVGLIGMDDDAVCPSGVVTTIFKTEEESNFISLTFNGEGIRIPIGLNEGEITKTYIVSDKVSHYPNRRFFDVSITMIIPFFLEGTSLEGKTFNVRAEFIQEDEMTAQPTKRRTYFVGTLDAGCKPVPAFVAKVLFRPTKVVFRITDENAPALNPHAERLTTAVLDLLDLECVTGSGPVKATRLRSDIKETSSNELIISGLADFKWTDFLKLLDVTERLKMTSKGQENWVSLNPHRDEDCSNYVSEKRKVAERIEAILRRHSGKLEIPTVMDRLFEDPVAGEALQKMMSPNWKTLRRILVREEAKGIRLEPCGIGCATVSLCASD